MSKSLILLAVAITLAHGATAFAQQQRVSPHETVSAVIGGMGRGGGMGGNRVTITYGRPYSKDPQSDNIRTIWGVLVPYGQPWRLGADEATAMILQRPIAIGETTIPAGAYTLYMIPAEGGGKLAFSSALGGWGVPVVTDKDVAQVDLRREALPMPNQQLEIAVGPGSTGGGTLRIMWEGAQYLLDFTNAP
jgi:hypothetical protein